MPSVNFLITLFLLVIITICHAEKITTVNSYGNTIIETISVDQWTETWTIPITTKIASDDAQDEPELESQSITTSPTSTTTAPTTTGTTLTQVTAIVSAGSIDDYSLYQASVSTELDSITSSEWAAFTATATNLGLYTGSATVSLSPPPFFLSASSIALVACIVISCI
ncbi:hypothetical protein BCR39DRAFT_546023 [Naematelia encephala]|uniref:Ser-Thr-rich glycosyl-phosphatidyl-inositol-anchored membrane family-domain-containing protein n=1 Tax=Naematelia encephala TaxID=71784 RepID=A0A1Y2ARS8_9TREE|nr:hypothetical protein BCR39DRAFT_546023 [Naematelia encephala]